MKKRTKIIILVVFLVLFIGIGVVLNGLFGNPLSKMIVKYSVNNYLSENYPDEDFEIKDVLYNFKTGDYDAKVISPTSIDTHFTVGVPFYKVRFDTYEEDVLSGWNTYRRMDDTYAKMVDEVINQADFTLESDIAFGTIEVAEENQVDAVDYALSMSELELDQDFDVKALAEQAGHLVIYAQDEIVTFEKASELLLLLKAAFDQADVPFYAVDFNLEQPKEDEQAQYDNVEGIYTNHFLAEEIVEKGLAEKIEAAHEALMDSYLK